MRPRARLTLVRINKVTVTNFRNLAEIEVPLEPGTVIVDENRAGKSNFIQALRLVLDPTLPNSDRYLRREDFSDGLSDEPSGWDPMADGAKIEVQSSSPISRTSPSALCAR